MEKQFRIGVISSTHGVRGEVKVFPTTDDPNRFKRSKGVYIVTKDNKQLPVEITQARFFKNMVIVKFKDYDNINDIEKYKGCDLVVDRENAVRLRKDEFFIADFINANVWTDEGEELGILGDVLETGANEVFVVKTKEGKEILIPVIKECVVDMNAEEMKITVHLLEGLLDL